MKLLIKNGRLIDPALGFELARHVAEGPRDRR
jgi:hypothetical protein